MTYTCLSLSLPYKLLSYNWCSGSKSVNHIYYHGSKCLLASVISTDQSGCGPKFRFTSAWESHMAYYFQFVSGVCNAVGMLLIKACTTVHSGWTSFSLYKILVRWVQVGLAMLLKSLAQRWNWVTFVDPGPMWPKWTLTLDPVRPTTNYHFQQIFFHQVFVWLLHFDVSLFTFEIIVD